MKFNFVHIDNKQFIFYIFLFFLPFSLLAQTKLRGLVKDGSKNEALIGAAVVIKGTTSGVSTDFDGNFELEVPNLPVTLVVSYIGYVTKELNVTSSKEHISAFLEEESTTLIEVQVKGQRISEKQKESPLTVEALDLIAIKETPAANFYNGLGNLKGVDLTTASLGFTIINTRGFNSTSPVRSLQIIDGVDNQAPGLNFSLGNFLGSSELDIQKVDLVVGASSAFYGPNAFNGVISMKTKNPFYSSGLSASVKLGERQLFETAIRYANIINNKAKNPFIAYKVNFSYLRANDWVANNYDPVYESKGNDIFAANQNPGGYNGVNIYGDEYYGSYASLYDIRAGLNTFNRKGYKEEDIVDYNTRNIKAGMAFYIRTNPKKGIESPEILLSSNFGYGTTVYQGDNRFSLKGIQFYQHKIEFRKEDKFFIRAYLTHENAGKSYDPYFTAQKMIEAAGENEAWQNSYVNWWTKNNLGNVFNQMKSLGYPNDQTSEQIKWQQDNKDKLLEWHKQATEYANKENKTFNTKDFYQPGTARFDSLFNDIISRKNNTIENGTKFSDRSALAHLHAEYKFNSNFFKELVLGANGRVYMPNTEGTIFSDSSKKIVNSEFGIYTGATKQIKSFIFSAALRLDKNQNFSYLFSPAGSVVWKPTENNYLRLSFSSAIRNPTLSDQYLNLKVGPARLIGNLTGYDSLITLESFNAWRSDPTSPFEYRNISPIKPEKVKTLELGYRTTLFNQIYVDASAFINRYDDFIGYQVGLIIPEIYLVPFPGSPPIAFKKYADTKVLRVAANSNEIVTSRGLSLGFNYYFMKYYSLNGNYSFNELITDVKDNIVPAFNTPKNKYNIGISGRDIQISKNKNTFGFNINYKWVQGFLFEGSPQFTGLIPSYDLLDAQINYTILKLNTVIKLGASNLLNNMQFQTYGGPRIGRMGYLSITYDFKSKI